MIDTKNKWRERAKIGGYLHVPACDMNELLDRLEAAERAAASYEKALKGVIDERDALAAHVEELNRDWVAHWDDCNSLCAYGDGRCSCGLANVQESKPDASLARQKLLWQAEVLERITADMRAKGKLVATLEALDAIADKRRRQAEAATPHRQAEDPTA